MAKFFDWVSERFCEALMVGWERFQQRAFEAKIEEDRKELPNARKR